MKKDRLEKLLEFLKNNPTDTFLQFAIAQEYEKNNDLEKAKIFYEKLRTNNPEYIATYYHLGKLYEKINKFNLAVETYETGLQKSKEQNDSHTYNELQQVYSLLKQP